MATDRARESGLPKWQPVAYSIFFTEFQGFCLQRSWRWFRTPTQPLDTPINHLVYSRNCTGIGRIFESGGRKAQTLSALHIGTLTRTCISFSCFVRFSEPVLFVPVITLIDNRYPRPTTITTTSLLCELQYVLTNTLSYHDS